MAPKRVAKGTGLISESASLSVAARIAEIERKRKIANGPEPRQAQGSTSIWRAAPEGHSWGEVLAQESLQLHDPWYETWRRYDHSLWLEGGAC